MEQKIIELNNFQREQLKNAQLELLDELKRFCCKNDITFYLYGGTLLGAVRHSGFIPWDDDIDVCMPRKDYDKFCRLYLGNDKYELQNTNTDRYYFYHFSKLLKKNTIYNEYFTCNIPTKKNIYIDIFPINGYPNDSNKVSIFHYNFWLFILNKKSYPRKLNKIRKIKRSPSYIIMTVLTFVLMWWCPSHLSAKLRNRFMKRHQFDGSENCIIGTNLRKRYKREFFKGSEEIEFENRLMPSPDNPHLYLKTMYGDYMQLPAESERIPHHFVIEFKA